MTDRQTVEYTVERVRQLQGDDVERLIDIQERSLSMLHATSAIDHVLKPHEIEAFARDERLLKFVLRSGEDFVGVFAVAHRPSEGWDQVADAFFEELHPGLMELERGKLAYLAGSFVAPEHQGLGAFAILLQDVYDWIEEHRIEAFVGDMPNVNYRWMMSMFERGLMARFGYADLEEVDTQHFVTVRFRYADLTIDLRGDEPLIEDRPT